MTKGRGLAGATKAQKRKVGAALAKNQVPLPVLEKRLKKLNSVVKKRGGDSY